MALTLLLHGFASTPASWRGVVERFPGEASAPRLLGHGGPSTAKSFDAEVDRIAATIRDRAPIVVAGYSMGGRLALGLAIRHPSLVRSAVLIGAHPGLEHAEERAQRISEDEARALRLESEGLAPFLERWDANAMFARRPSPPRHGLDAGGLAHALRVLGLGRMDSRWSSLPDLRIPLTWLVGADDTKHRAISERAARLARARRLVVEGSDHDVLGCRPDVVADVLAKEAA